MLIMYSGISDIHLSGMPEYMIHFIKTNNNDLELPPYVIYYKMSDIQTVPQT